MKIRIITWNMAYWSHKGCLEATWDYFLSLDAEFYIFQEAKRPKSLINDKNFIWHPTGMTNGRKEWGLGIYSKKHQLTEEPDVSTPEWGRDRFSEMCVLVNTRVSNINLTLISLYGRIDKIGSIGYSIPNLHRIFSDLTGVLRGHINGKRNIILAGDLNASIQFDQQSGRQSHKIFFDRLKDFELENCFELNGNKNFVQTLRFPKSTINWQNDYFFVSKSLSKNFEWCEVIDSEKVQKYSDHNPVVITLDL